MTNAVRGFDLERELSVHWLRWTLLAWALIAAWFLWDRWGQINALALGDTDDNMRLMQVRALLDGQGWYDLRQYRLSPPGGLDIHWSRLVDLPLAALILLFKPFVGTPMAERLACGIAPLLPLAVTMAALGATVRRLVAPAVWPIATIILLGCGATMLMFMPLRIDHHGWQLACLALTLAGIADPKGARGGVIVGLSSAASLTIGLELLPYCAIAGAIVTLRWVWDGGEVRRMQAYALSLAGGSTIGFAVFASNANYAMRCDALTPVWLSVTIAAGLLLFAISLLNPANRVARLGLAAVAGAAIAGGFAALFPQCLSRPEGVSDELYDIWLSNVREARPIYRHSFAMGFPIAVLPVIGIIGAAVAAWRARASAVRLTSWIAIGLFTAFAGAMLLWQIRAGPAAQLLAIPGATALVWMIVPWFLNQKYMAVRVVGAVVAFLLFSGLFTGFVVKYVKVDKPQKARSVVNRANARCASAPGMSLIDRSLPPATLFTHVDLGPRLIVMTHHKGIAGPYHRNEQAILDVHHAFAGSPDAFRGIAKRYGAQYLLVCPNMAETTIYRSRAPNGFYGQLAKGKTFTWLDPVKLPEKAPYRLWRIRYGK
ncbi:AcrB/AcrD/AcrF family protein [Sphingomonas koreensis]|uniref:AcrB/AcrD/AcrF family protein n=1 Tax=Sphingomonas koreensis TaxID=93064 RepID=UPI000A5F1BAF|nr:AcrB/AcrD/AcrF family protein [Sphingomonas koreensis]MDC7811666.1 AcrB/AcrD/AcrF family protein [Sphingomonas koreensis]